MLFAGFALRAAVPALLTPLRLFSRTPVKATAQAAIPTYRSLVIAEQSRLQALDPRPWPCAMSWSDLARSSVYGGIHADRNRVR